MPREASEVQKVLDLLRAELKRAPWWAGLIGIGLAYLMFRLLIPFALGVVGGAEDGQPNMTQMIGNISRVMAPYASLVVAGVWIIALVDKFIDNQRLDRQRGIDTIREMSWREFEQLLATAYERQGYRVTDTGHTHGPGSPDGGIDLILEKSGKRYLVQCKQWKARKVGVKVARELYGLVASEHADGGILITSGQYTQEARTFAEKLPLKLIDGPKLESLIQSVQSPTKHKPRQERPNTPTTSPTTIATPSVPLCPTCQSPMLKRKAKRGTKAGQSFWGCPSYPKCRGTRPL